jgi:hypothetical protein
MNTPIKSLGCELQLQQGQLWKVRGRYVRIVELVDSYTRFKFLSSPQERGERLLTSGIDTLLRYLMTRKARVVNPSDIFVAAHRPMAGMSSVGAA